MNTSTDSHSSTPIRTDTHFLKFPTVLQFAMWKEHYNYCYFFTINVKVAMMVGPIKTHKEISLLKICVIDKYLRQTVRQQREVYGEMK